jgi:hypothetical protein
MQSYDEWLRSRQEEPLLHLLCAFDGSIDDLLLERVISTLDSPAVGHAVQSGAMSSLEDLRLVSTFQTGGVPYRELHPLVRTYFRAKLQRADSELWRSVNLAIARTLESLPASWRPGAMDEISMLYQAAAHYCRADNRQHAWRVIYQDRLMHGTEHFAVELRGALSSTVSLLGELLPERSDDGGTDLTDPDLLDLLIDAGTYMSAMFSYADPGAGACYRDGIALASALDVPSSRLVCSLGAARHARFNGRLDQALEITADELSRIANSPVGDRADDPHASLLSCLYREHCSTLFFLGRIEECRIFAALGAGLDVAIHEQATEMARILVNDPVQSCEGYLALCDSRDGDHEAAGHRVDRVLATLETQPHPHTEAVILLIACMVEENAGHADRVAFFADRMRILSTDRGFGQWAIAAEIFSVWAGAIIGNSLEPPSAISDLVDRWRLSGSWLFVPYFLHLQSEAEREVGDDRSAATAARAQQIAQRTGEIWPFSTA